MEIEYAKLITDVKNQIITEEADAILDHFLNTPPSSNTPFETLSAALKFGFSDVFPFTYILKTVLVAVIVFFILNLFQAALCKTNIFNTLKYFATLSVLMATVLPAYKLICNASNYMKDISTFIGVFFPAFGIITASGGNIAAAKSQSLFFSIILGTSQIVLNKIVPTVLTFLFGVAVIDAFSGEGKLAPLSNFIKNSVFGIFTILISLLYIVICVYGQAAKGADTLSARALRLLVGNAIPIIGGTVGQSLKFVASGIISLKNTVGISAVIFILSLFLPILIFLWGSGFMLNFVTFLCDYFGVQEIKVFVSHIKCAFDFALASFSAITVAAILNINAFLSVTPTLAM